jgi:hypothetical protein
MKKSTKNGHEVKTQFTVDEVAKVIPLRVTDTGYIETIKYVREHSDLSLRGSKELVDDVRSGEYARFSALSAKEQLGETECGHELGMFPDEATRDYWVARFKSDPAQAYHDLLAVARQQCHRSQGISEAETNDEKQQLRNECEWAALTKKASRTPVCGEHGAPGRQDRMGARPEI